MVGDVVMTVPRVQVSIYPRRDKRPRADPFSSSPSPANAAGGSSTVMDPFARYW
jgi:hypothetical protein